MVRATVARRRGLVNVPFGEGQRLRAEHEMREKQRERAQKGRAAPRRQWSLDSV
jgi:hypothetical protein